ncbi:MAG: hybrid sensor histidine kinase/response regulator [Anaerolineae bacterium]
MAASLISTTKPEFPLREPHECKVLVVDDDPGIVELIRDMLALDGYQILSAQGGLSALKMVAEHSPDVVLLDVLLPDVDGITVCRKIKEDPKTHFLPVVLVTGVNDRARRIDGLRARADDFINKPFDQAELSVRVRSLIRTRQLTETVENQRQELEQRVAERTRELQDALEQLRSLDQLKGNIIAIISHELRTPLHQANTALALLLDPNVSEADRKDLFETLRDKIGELEYLIGNVQAFSDPTDLRLAPVPAAHLVTHAVEQVRALRKGKSFNVETDLPKDLPPVNVHAAPMTRAIAHIIHNAVKFGGDKPVRVRAERVPDGVRLTVQDQGDGIPPEQMDRLFKPLTPLNDSSTRRQGGIGIGLALVKMILDAHKIDLSFVSEVDKGTTVSFVLPLADI